ncbi:MAG: 4-hydroxy-tetrahydrodipicolinate reductase [Lentisphaeria bacterium]|nr:4-hydroxy-tetrahydrodipicolinate reductase [Lentisphaeria bacterium]
MIRIAIVGAAGRMGRMLVGRVKADPELCLAGATETPGSDAVGLDAGTLAGVGDLGIVIVDCIENAIADADAVIDFSAPGNTMAIAPVICGKGLGLVIGTTGLSDADRVRLADLADNGARIMQAPNMSVGINLLFSLCAKVAPLLGDEYDIEVVEMHHNRKMDAPSGTAERLGQILAESVGLEYNSDTRHGRVGQVGARTKREIGMHALRGGDVVGDHTVIFAADGERVELVHKASSRETFAKGALRAVKFLASAPPGLYDMQDVLGLH